ncbi:glycosyltransferase family 4 protein [Nonlabens sp.]|uniref:glycosyltransferase family 4 protein n=1 Tax=Nonlabens sp. TaxID=1888209 RepID=UPI0025DA613B|nr:glycosyltransferase family 4 protein [Nonlabens sp.]
MRILLVSMNSIHFRRWSEQLRDSGHEVYWFDILDQGDAPSISWMTQITGWKKGFLKKRGRTFIKNRSPKLYTALVNKYDTKVEEAFAKAVQEIQPDAIHSFALYVSCTPILPVMLQNNIPWIYSSWGSDLFYFRKDSSHLKDIKKVLPRVNYMFADCKRDQEIATELGFIGTHLGVFPGGGGFDLEAFKTYQIPQSQRKIIAVKGNENRSGRAVPVLKALEQLCLQLTDLEVVVFGVENDAVFQFQEGSIPHLTIKGLMEHEELIRLFCSSLIYIGNSNSDGMPNTLLEAICAGAFPIQSNPGGATAELIKNKKNGLLIEDCENSEEIQQHISFAIQNLAMIENAFVYNQAYAQEHLSREVLTKKALKMYQMIPSIERDNSSPPFND